MVSHEAEDTTRFPKLPSSRDGRFQRSRMIRTQSPSSPARISHKYQTATGALTTNRITRFRDVNQSFSVAMDKHTKFIGIQAVKCIRKSTNPQRYTNRFVASVIHSTCFCSRLSPSVSSKDVAEWKRVGVLWTFTDKPGRLPRDLPVRQSHCAR